MDVVGMFFHVLYLVFWFYVLVSYGAGAWLFYHEIGKNPKQLLPFGIILFILSPLTAWHGVLHYIDLYRSGKL